MHIVRTCNRFSIDDCKTANRVTYCYCNADRCNGPDSLNKSQLHAGGSATPKRENAFYSEHKFDDDDGGGDDDEDSSGGSDIERFLDTDWQMANSNVDHSSNVSFSSINISSTIGSTTPGHHSNHSNSNECTRVTYILVIPIIVSLSLRI